MPPAPGDEPSHPHRRLIRPGRRYIYSWQDTSPDPAGVHDGRNFAETDLNIRTGSCHPKSVHQTEAGRRICLCYVGQTFWGAPDGEDHGYVIPGCTRCSLNAVNSWRMGMLNTPADS